MNPEAAPKMNENGFTLIELLIAVLILFVITVSIMGLLPQAYKQITNGGRISVLNHLGYEKLDELQSLGYSNAELTAGTHPATPAGYPRTGDFSGYSVTWTVTDTDYPPVSGVKVVVVEVGYQLYKTDGTQIPQNPFQLREVFSTYITE